MLLLLVVQQFLHCFAGVSVRVVRIGSLLHLSFGPPFTTMTSMDEFVLLNIVDISLVKIILHEIARHGYNNLCRIRFASFGSCKLLTGLGEPWRSIYT